MHHRVDAVLRSVSQHLLPVADVRHDQRRIEHALAEAGGQIVEHDHALAARAQLQHRVAADVAGAAGD